MPKRESEAVDRASRTMAEVRRALLYSGTQSTKRLVKWAMHSDSPQVRTAALIVLKSLSRLPDSEPTVETLVELRSVISPLKEALREAGPSAQDKLPKNQ